MRRVFSYKRQRFMNSELFMYGTLSVVVALERLVLSRADPIARIPEHSLTSQRFLLVGACFSGRCSPLLLPLSATATSHLSSHITGFANARYPHGI